MKPLDLVQAQFVKALQVPIVRPIANATFNQVLLTVTSGPQVKQAFSPNPVNPDYTQQLKAVNLKSSDLKTFADEALDFNAPAQLVPQFNLITTPAWVVQGMQDKLVSPASVKTMAHELPHARYIQLSGGHMQTWVHPNQVANAIRSASR
jgi:pimeloyl-ACP methyl ester carboxylesterase